MNKFQIEYIKELTEYKITSLEISELKIFVFKDTSNNWSIDHSIGSSACNSQKSLVIGIMFLIASEICRKSYLNQKDFLPSNPYILHYVNMVSLNNLDKLSQ